MEIKKLNCTSCGASLAVDESFDIAICPYCGSNFIVERKGDDLSLRFAKNVKEALIQASKETSSSIRESSQATQAELKKIQLQQQILTLQNELSIINSDIRNLEREKNSRKVKRQLRELKTRKFILTTEINKLQPNTQEKKLNKETIKISKWVLIIVGVLIILLCALIGSLPEKNESSKDNISENEIRQTVITGYTQTAEQIPTNTTEPTEPVIAPTFQEIQEKVNNMTEVQWKEYLPTLKGMKVDNWSGWVVDIDKDLGDEYKIWVDMDNPNEALSTQDVYLYGITEEEASVINKDAHIYFSGIISNISEFFGDVTISIDNVFYQVQ
jgi:DNA-directed RNA polymerase subunit RPC12/RpoP